MSFGHERLDVLRRNGTPYLAGNPLNIAEGNGKAPSLRGWDSYRSRHRSHFAWCLPTCVAADSDTDSDPDLIVGLLERRFLKTLDVSE